MECTPGSDQAFGPRVHPACRSFDFTLMFEDIILTCIPAAVLLCVLPVYIGSLLRRPCVNFSYNKLLGGKMIILAFMFGTQLAVIVLRSQTKPTRTQASLASDILSLVATAMLVVIYPIHYRRSLRSSSVVSLYLSAYVILGTARARTLWSIHTANGPAAALIASLVLAFAALLAETVTNTRAHTIAGRKYSEQYSGFWARAVFAWLVTTFRLGYAQVMIVDDLPELDEKLQSHNLHRTLLSTWMNYDRKRRHSLIRACFRAYFPSFLSAIIPRLCLSGFTFAQPFLISSTIAYVGEDDAQGRNFGKGLVGAWALVFMGIAVSSSIYQYQSFRFVTRVRAGLTALVYQQSLEIRASEQGKVTAIAILGADLPQIVAGLQMLHEIWASVLDVAIATWLLERTLSLACLAPVILVFVFVGITSRISGMAKTKQLRWIEMIQARLKATSDLLENIKTIKMLGLTDAMSKILQSLRRDEIKASTGYRKVLLSILLLSNTPLNLAPTVTFAVYVIISVYWRGTSLEISQAFTSIALISLLTAPAMLFTQVLPRVLQALGCFDRVEEYCNYSSYSPRRGEMSDAKAVPAGTTTKSVFASDDIELNTKAKKQDISLPGNSYKWKPDGPDILKNLKVDIPPGVVSAIVGPVGSGKSTLLETILGETISSSETLSHRRSHLSPVAYCSQKPWLADRTIRDTIVGEADYDGQWYRTVKTACDLDADVTRQPEGDMTRIGHGLSGGQKQRIALARAIYSRSSIVLLDDVFSGMDAHTVNVISHRLLHRDGLLRRQQTTVVLTTTNRNVLALVDNVIALQDGEVLTKEEPQCMLHGETSGSKLESLMFSDAVADESPESERSSATAKKEAAIKADQGRKNSDLATYTYYFANSGWHLLLGNIVSVTIWMFLTEFSTVWLKWWSEENEKHPNRRVGMYVGLYASFGVIGTVAACIGGWFLLVRMVSKSGDQLHRHLLQATLCAPFSFFTTTDIGELMNRFSQDMELVDMSLPAMVSSYITCMMQCLVKLAILLVFSRYLGVAVPVLGALIYLLQRFYLLTSRQVRLLGIEAKAPLYSSFMDSLAGATTIRAFGWQQSYQQRSYGLIDNFQRPEYIQSCVQHWLSFVLDTIVAILAVLVVAIIVIWPEKFDTGSVGVSLVMIIGFSTTLMRVIRSWTSMESSIGAISRIRQYTASTASSTGLCLAVPDPNWVQCGSLHLESLRACYSPDGDTVLHDISMSIKPMEHIAICGRSGSGKTSIILSILQMMHVKNGSIKVDGIDLASLDGEALRKSMNVVPQDPFLMPGTVRYNADPFDMACDDEIVQALVRVGLWNKIQEEGGLSRPMNRSAWSTGQRQLFCLARAMTRKGKILLLDEATSSVDHNTQSTMQEIIDLEFKHTTVIAILHRMDHIQRYDKVAFLDHGRLLEFGRTEDLMAAPESQLAKLYHSDGN